jgi:hypothetical protein
MRILKTIQSRVVVWVGVRCIRIFGPLVFVISNGWSQAVGSEGQNAVVLVPPFENQSRYHENVNYEVATGKHPDKPKRRCVVDRYTESPRSLLEDLLCKMQGVTVVERQRVDAILLESEFGAVSGLVDFEKAFRLGKMLGANVIVMGAIVDMRDEKREFHGYGIHTKNVEVMCSIRIRVLDIATGTVTFSKILKGSANYSESSYGRTSSSDKHFSAIETTLQELRKTREFKDALVPPEKRPNLIGLVEVEFAPKPENCDIEIDGKYVGGSPLKRALPAGQEIKVRISKGGYTSWEGIVVPEKGLHVTRELEQRR